VGDCELAVATVRYGDSNAIGSTIEGSAFSGLFTRVEIGRTLHGREAAVSEPDEQPIIEEKDSGFCRCCDSCNLSTINLSTANARDNQSFDAPRRRTTTSRRVRQRWRRSLRVGGGNSQTTGRVSVGETVGIDVSEGAK
jgi:hypothetical protein